jgi:methionyl-tRNA formyltransferase
MKVVFMGTPDFAVTTLQAIFDAGHEILLVVTQPDKPRGRSGKLQFSPVKAWAVDKDIPVFQPRRIRDEEAVSFLQAYPADIFIVAAFGQILPKEILDMPPLGCVNVHASLLPKYRGAAPIQWAVINGDAVSGVTTMQMGVGLDDGDILQQEEVVLAGDETGGSLFDRLAVTGAALCVRTMASLEQGSVVPRPQDEDLATHVGMIKKEMGRLDFSRPAIELERLVRGLDPWPSAFTSLGGKTLKIWKAAVTEKIPEEAAPGASCGTVVFADKDGIYVATGKDYLVLKVVQLEGKKRMEAADFLRGHSIEAGTVLGKNG